MPAVAVPVIAAGQALRSGFALAPSWFQSCSGLVAPASATLVESLVVSASARRRKRAIKTGTIRTIVTTVDGANAVARPGRPSKKLRHRRPNRTTARIGPRESARSRSCSSHDVATVATSRLGIGVARTVAEPCRRRRSPPAVPGRAGWRWWSGRSGNVPRGARETERADQNQQETHAEEQVGQGEPVDQTGPPVSLIASCTTVVIADPMLSPDMATRATPAPRHRSPRGLRRSAHPRR